MIKLSAVLLLSITWIMPAAKASSVDMGQSRWQTLMDVSLWRPAGTLLSEVFPGLDASWLKAGDSVWTLPGSKQVERDTVQHRGQRLPNHMQYSVVTRYSYESFKLSVDFTFEDDSLDSLPLSWLGNSGIYIFGLYEVQIFNTSLFNNSQYLPSHSFADGVIELKHGAKDAELPLNQFLCGAIYGGGVADSSTDGAPMFNEHTYANLCARKGWHRMEVVFVPPAFKGGRKIACAVIAVTIDGHDLLFGGRPFYAVPAPTGSQRNKPELARGPIVIQDHGSKVSFRSLRIDPNWSPAPESVKAAMSEAAAACALAHTATQPLDE